MLEIHQTAAGFGPHRPGAAVELPELRHATDL